MNKIIIKIAQGQHLSDVFQIHTNIILCKTLTGIGATYSEIKARRNSIIVVPNLPPIKCKCEKHKKDNLFGVMQGVTVDDVVEYLEKTIESKKQIKLITTPESFHKIREAFQELDMNMHLMCFMLLDECDKFVKDCDYREDITLPIDDFFEFQEKAMVSATPIIPSDPRFEEQGFSIVEIVPDFDYSKNIELIHTNNVLEALRETLPKVEQQFIYIFANSTDMIYQLIIRLDIADESAVFCAAKSVEKLKHSGFKSAYENWDSKHAKHYNFCTSRFYSALDIELNNKPAIIFLTEPYFAEYTTIDPCTDAIQAIGRFRNGVASIRHIVNICSGFPVRDEKGIDEYLAGCKTAYKVIQNLYNCAPSIEIRNAYRNALEVLPFNKMLTNGKQNCFAIDNYKYEALVKSAYNNIGLLKERYGMTKHFNIIQMSNLFYKFGDKERLTLERKGGSLTEKRRHIVEILESFKDDMDSPLVKDYIEDLRKRDAFIVEAYETVGKEVIELNRYRCKKIKEAMILKNYREKTTGVEFVQLLHNSFKLEHKYPLKYIKEELIRLYDILGITPKKSITAQTIRDFFDVKECKVGKNKGLQLISSKI